MILNIQYIDLKFQFTLPKIGLPKINTLSPPMVRSQTITTLPSPRSPVAIQRLSALLHKQLRLFDCAHRVKTRVHTHVSKPMEQ